MIAWSPRPWLLLLLATAGCSTHLRVLDERERPEPVTTGGDRAPIEDGSIADANGDDRDGGLGGPSGRYDVDVGPFHSCAIVGGPLYCWGDNEQGQLGIPDRASVRRPMRVGKRSDWAKVSLGARYTCALDTQGKAHCWGDNSHGQLGIGTRRNHHAPTEVMLPGRIEHLQTGWEHACAILEDGALYCWGENEEGQLGQDDPFPDEGRDRPVPVHVTNKHFRQVAPGQGHTCAISEQDELLCWGRNSSGELGTASPEGQVRVPEPVGLQQPHHLAASMLHTCASTTAGKLWCWGQNSESQLGLGDQVDRDTPTPILETTQIDQVAVAAFSTCIVQSDRQARCWGRNIEGQLGMGDDATIELPTKVDLPGPVLKITPGRFHTCAALRDGSVYCSGNNSAGELGLGDDRRRARFEQVLGPTSLDR